ncbi:transcriptional regulator [Puteibacter caeruleilacunae]|nr:transcriptional regulator [Puteibacter caeruleilacunae]
MKDKLQHINKAFESKVRLGIMSVLITQPEVPFKTLKEILGLTDGNLASHLKALEKLEYIQVSKTFVGRKPQTTYQITKQGDADFKAHIQALENFLNSQRP